MTEPEDRVMREFWAIKEECWREVAHLPLREAIRKRLRRARETAVRLNLGNSLVPAPRRTALK